MCGRYYVDEGTVREIEKLVKEPDMELLQKGEICPSQTAAVIVQEGSKMVLRLMKWGFQIPGQKNLIINARSESVLQKKIFSDSVMRRRCVIPAHRFYEWDSDKNKVSFKLPTSTGMFMSGFWKFEEDTRRFVILTTQANDSVSFIHDRMPLILNAGECELWLQEGQEYEQLLKKYPGVTLDPEGNVQQNLFRYWLRSEQ